MNEGAVASLLAIGATVLIFEGPVVCLKAWDSFQGWRERKAPASRRLVGIDWLDPDLRRN